jgi:DNA-binding CsgD family transcriptional regulator
MSAPRALRSKTSSNHTAPASTLAIVRHLIASLQRKSSGPAAKSDGFRPRVLLDVEVDEVRCVLVRSPKLAIRLSRRELDIIRMVGDGLTNKAVATQLEISIWTVNTHLRRIFLKLGVRSRAAMVRAMAIKRDVTWASAARRPVSGLHAR